jgi:hypothetical protein
MKTAAENSGTWVITVLELVSVTELVAAVEALDWVKIVLVVVLV